MGKVVTGASVSLDGYIAGPEGEIDWAAPGEDLMDFHNEQTSELAAHLSGRRLYEDMLPWETRTRNATPVAPSSLGCGRRSPRWCSPRPWTRS